MASLEDLKAAVREVLEKRGVMDDLRATVRAEVFRTLDEDELTRPRPDGDTWLLNELIREYLDYHALRHTASVFIPESGQNAHTIDRQYLIEQTGTPADDPRSRPIPLLYALLAQSRELARMRATSAPPTSSASAGASGLAGARS